MKDNILRLTLTKKWFDMILSGEKTEEYREIKPYWISRLCERHPKSVIAGGDMIDRHNGTNYSFLSFDFVEFTNGYGDHRPRFTAKFDGIGVGVGNYAWGAPNILVFIIKIGEIVSKENME